VTITYGDRAENHVGMQQVGQLAENGFTYADLDSARQKFEALGCECELVDLRSEQDALLRQSLPAAHVLIVHDAVSKLLDSIGKNADDMIVEHNHLNLDKKAFMYGRVVNKSARYNLCFSTFSQEPDYSSGKGRIVDYIDVPLTSHIRDRLPHFIGEVGKNLQAEGNYYYDSSKCGIGFHGDAERRKVIAVRLGKPLPLVYQWFHRKDPVGKPVTFSSLGNGDMYIMSEKATGFDWKKSSIYTLRHAAGAAKFTTYKKNIKNKKV